MTADVLYPTMYLLYSFYQCYWELREFKIGMKKDIEYTLISIALENLVRRQILYVGWGNSPNITFRTICAQNKLEQSYFERILQPAPSETNGPENNKSTSSLNIQSSDGSTVSIRWYSTQEDRIEVIIEHDLLKIQVAPMIAAIEGITPNFYSNVSDLSSPLGQRMVR